ncbi:MAG: hypothetical protein JWP37_1795 [Mucilaginibacter sp.]|nr:hypothetical protein [Mucilaginibacter sp.]
MKNFIMGLAMISMLSLSCTKVIYTNEQVIDRYKTKQDLMKKFGAPTEKQKDSTAERWLYKYESSTIESRNTNSLDVKGLGAYKRCLIFTMDLQGNIVRWDNKGVDMTERVKNKHGTVALIIVGSSLVVLVVLGSILAANSLNFGTGVY